MSCNYFLQGHCTTGQNTIRIRHTSQDGELEQLEMCDGHAIHTYDDAAARLGGTVYSVELSGTATRRLQQRRRQRGTTRRSAAQ